MRTKTRWFKVARKSLKNIPETPGVYMFWAERIPIYIGKAKNLPNRIGGYFGPTLADKTSRMVHEAQALSIIEVTSELEALLLEAMLIRKHMPRYNVAARDDKHPLYIKITNEDYPRVVTARKDNLEDALISFGPFPSSRNVYQVLRMLRRIFPFSDHALGSRPCLYSHLGQCAPCPNEIVKSKNEKEKRIMRKQYRHNINMIKNILSRRIDKVMSSLTRKMETLSKEEKFEQAAFIREQLRKLEYVTQPIIPAEEYLANPNLVEDVRDEEVRSLSGLLTNHYPRITSLHRIECFDVAHLAGLHPAASMVTFVDGEADKNFYRHFRVRQKEGANDIASLSEIAGRRVKHLDSWGRPDVVVVDGGRGQVGVFAKVFKSYDIPVVGLAKRHETLVIPTSEDNKFLEVRLKGPALNLLQRLRNEAHRFAQKYHHKLVSRGLTH